MEELSTEIFYSLDFQQLGDSKNVLIFALLDRICTECVFINDSCLGTSRIA